MDLAKRHFQKKHKLTTMETPKDCFTCQVCMVVGFRSREVCDKCGLILHRSCHKRLKKVTCKITPQSDDDNEHYMRFKFKESEILECSVCQEHILAAYYYCMVCHCEMHPTCRLLQKSSTTYPDTSEVFYHPGYASQHSHTLLFVNETNNYNCSACKTIGFGLRMNCTPCEASFHPYCIKNEIRDLKTKYCFMHSMKHKMIWVREGPQEEAADCTICSKNIAGSHFFCDLSGMRVHPICAKIQDLDNDYHFGMDFLNFFAELAVAAMGN